MRAAVIREYGAVPAVEIIAEPQEQDGTSRIRVIAAGLQPTDIMRSTGAYNPPALPYVIGGEGVGQTEDGTRVYFGHSIPGFGAIGEMTVVSDEEIWPIPDDVTADQAIALAIAGTGALIPLQEANIQPAEAVLVLGATGPLGQVALQLARILGAGRVIAAARSAQPLASLAQRGLADEIVQLGKGDDNAALQSLGGYDVVLDCVFGPPAEAALRALSPGGRMMSIGVGAGMHVTLSLGELVQKSIHGVGTGQRPVEERRAAFDKLIGWHRDGRLTVTIQRFTLDAIADAWQLQRRSPGGKIVISIMDDD